ncbi:MAG: GFA family protein [Burkholderiales bacterium]|nr:GFA family protein [Burkholderiales bacterium]
MTVYRGHCLCGGIRFEVRGPLAPVQICHCSQCRRAQGTPLVTNVPVAADAFTLLQGQALLAAFESSPGKQRVLCRRCGSPVFSRREALPGVLRLRLGLLDEPVDVALQAHAHVGSKAGWWPICDTLPQFDAGLPQAPQR